MTPEQFESQVLGAALAFMAFAAVVALIVRHEWVVSRPDRESRQRQRVK